MHAPQKDLERLKIELMRCLHIRNLLVFPFYATSASSLKWRETLRELIQMFNNIPLVQYVHEYCPFIIDKIMPGSSFAHEAYFEEAL